MAHSAEEPLQLTSSANFNLYLKNCFGSQSFGEIISDKKSHTAVSLRTLQKNENWSSCLPSTQIFKLTLRPTAKFTYEESRA
jgi:hypothetical protein